MSFSDWGEVIREVLKRRMSQLAQEPYPTAFVPENDDEVRVFQVPDGEMLRLVLAGLADVTEIAYAVCTRRLKVPRTAKVQPDDVLKDPRSEPFVLFARRNRDEWAFWYLPYDSVNGSVLKGVVLDQRPKVTWVGDWEEMGREGVEVWVWFE